MDDIKQELIDLSEYENDFTKKYIPIIVDKFHKCQYSDVVEIEIPEQSIQGRSTYRFSMIETQDDYSFFVGFVKEDGEEEYFATPFLEKDVIDMSIPITDYLDNLIAVGICVAFDDNQEY